MSANTTAMFFRNRSSVAILKKASTEIIRLPYRLAIIAISQERSGLADIKVHAPTGIRRRAEEGSNSRCLGVCHNFARNEAVENTLKPYDLRCPATTTQRTGRWGVPIGNRCA
jgi:hypothetical protein